jgi:hypothetical protein
VILGFFSDNEDMKGLVPVLLMVAYTAAAEDALQGMVPIDSEPVWAVESGAAYPLSRQDSRRAALFEAAAWFTGMVYGWQFDYEPGDRTREIEEVFDWMPLGELAADDPRITLAAVKYEGSIIRFQANYEMDAAQTARRAAWKGGQIRTMKAQGQSDLEQNRQEALKDAAKHTIRTMVRGSERERPKAIRGRIALAEFPVITISGGSWAATAKFFVEIQEIQKFKGY